VDRDVKVHVSNIGSSKARLEIAVRSEEPREPGDPTYSHWDGASIRATHCPFCGISITNPLFCEKHVLFTRDGKCYGCEREKNMKITVEELE
jgi:hypothetical protein